MSHRSSFEIIEDRIIRKYEESMSKKKSVLAEAALKGEITGVHWIDFEGGRLYEMIDLDKCSNDEIRYLKSNGILFRAEMDKKTSDLRDIDVDNILARNSRDF
ncbi:hypothetical protein M3M38_07370 [Fructilactobacillus cliffordii]|uniref:hypothetical protein n=1 Tax=Fructilactobacillus cliffordii TaxID=2940299 RepID=UPI0020930024|nr:hypothetical protein [Fructilactobacillus cliffordii]USS86479.1 hypothetical protein M3M38_07370 [Fructilactobacillus cliffordii]